MWGRLTLRLWVWFCSEMLAPRPGRAHRAHSRSHQTASCWPSPGSPLLPGLHSPLTGMQVAVMQVMGSARSSLEIRLVPGERWERVSGGGQKGDLLIVLFQGVPENFTSTTTQCGSVGWSIVSCTKSWRVQSPAGVHMGGSWSMFLFHIKVSFPLCLSPFLSLSQISKCILW